MIVPTENKCLQCKRIFCCAKCRIKHEISAHTGSEVEPLKDASCTLCIGQRFTLQKLHSNEMIEHLVKHHLPLRCNKCAKVFASFADFLAMTACRLLTKDSCELQFEPAATFIDKIGRIMPVATSSTDDPNEKENIHANDSHLTPITQWNLRWKSKIGVGLLTDSISSIRNVSSLANNTSSNLQLSHLTHSPHHKNKLVRQTSTPMQRCMTIDGPTGSHGSHQAADVLARKQPNSFDSINSSEQISSISPNVSSGSDCNMTDPINRATPPKQKTSRLRNKLPVSATPLRQVMSRSIQKAMKQHGYQIKFMPSRMNFSPVKAWSPVASPLDLRTSPVIRRSVTHSSDSDCGSAESCIQQSNCHQSIEEQESRETHENLPVAPKNSHDLNEDGCIESVYESCKSYEVKAQENTPPMSLASMGYMGQTPKTTGTLIKSNSFAERQAFRPSSYDEDIDVNVIHEHPEEGASGGDQYEPVTSDEELSEQWFTPCAKIRRSPSAFTNILQRNQIDFVTESKEDKDAEDSESMWVTDNEFSENESVITEKKSSDESPPVKSSKHQSGRGLWSIVTSVMRMASFGQEPPKVVAEVGVSLLKRCATYAGRITPLDHVEEDQTFAASSDCADLPSNKRRRTKTSGSQDHQKSQTRKISGRPPLKRMRRVQS